MPECQTAWVRTDCKNQLMTKFTASRQRVNLCVYIHTSPVKGVLYKQWRLSDEMPNDAAFHLGFHCL